MYCHADGGGRQFDEDGQMASWVFICKSCGQIISHTAIPDTIRNYLFPDRPTLAVEDVAKVCPHCSILSTYAQRELIYEKG
jgi:hypothetical protein